MTDTDEVAADEPNCAEPAELAELLALDLDVDGLDALMAMHFCVRKVR